MIRRIALNFAGLLLVGLVMLALSGCEVEKAVNQAEMAVDSARAVHADQLAPYEFASAEQFLAGAKRELYESHYDSAQVFANRALQMATSAETLARKKHAEPMVPWSPNAPGAAPAPASPAAPKGGTK